MIKRKKVQTENKNATDSDHETTKNKKEDISRILDESFRILNENKKCGKLADQLKSTVEYQTFDKNVRMTNAKHRRKQLEMESKPLKLARFLLSFWDIIILSLLILLFSTYLIFFLNIYMSPNQRVKFNHLSKNLTKLTNWFIGKWMHFNGFTDLTKEECAVVAPDIFNSILRPIDDCSMCHGLDHIERVDTIDQESFLNKYAYTGVPVVITNAIKHWPAMKVFSFEFMKHLYLNMSEAEVKRKRRNKIETISKSSTGKTVSGEEGSGSPILNTFNLLVETENERTRSYVKDTCQFFAYKTKFKSLRQVFEVEKDEKGKWKMPWYVGWSNCNSYASQVLRDHYERPHFLPGMFSLSF
jgi:hypothetical protein